MKKYIRIYLVTKEYITCEYYEDENQQYIDNLAYLLHCLKNNEVMRVADIRISNKVMFINPEKVVYIFHENG